MREAEDAANAKTFKLEDEIQKKKKTIDELYYELGKNDKRIHGYQQKLDDSSKKKDQLSTRNTTLRDELQEAKREAKIQKNKKKNIEDELLCRFG